MGNNGTMTDTEIWMSQLSDVTKSYSFLDFVLKHQKCQTYSYPEDHTDTGSGLVWPTSRSLLTLVLTTALCCSRGITCSHAWLWVKKFNFFKNAWEIVSWESQEYLHIVFPQELPFLCGFETSNKLRKATTLQYFCVSRRYQLSSSLE